MPVVIPDLGEVRSFANHLHATGKDWKGEMFGWPAEFALFRVMRVADNDIRGFFSFG